MYEMLPQSRRPDGSLRPAVRVKKGYVPPEEQEKYDRWKSEAQVGVVGADPDAEVPKASAGSKTAAKNAKRNARRKAEQQADPEAETGGNGVRGQQATFAKGTAPAATSPPAAPTSDSARESQKGDSEVEKKLKNLRKRLKQIVDLEEKMMNGATLNADQCGKVAAKPAVEADIAKWEALGDTDIEKRVKALKKKTRQIEELEERQKKGEVLNVDQQGKLVAKQAIFSEMQTLEEMLAKM